MWLSFVFSTAAHNNQLLLLCRPQFSAFCPDPWALLSQAGLFREPTVPSPLPLLLQGDLAVKDSFFLLPVYHPDLMVLNYGSSYAQIPCSNVLVCSLCVFLLSFSCSAYYYFKGRDLGTSFTPPHFIPHSLQGEFLN